jgi:ABC-type transport system involved in multi-copper enzyme maturation permease subunit
VRRASRKRSLLLMGAAITLLAGLFAFTLQLDVVDGVVSGMKMFGAPPSGDLQTPEGAMLPMLGMLAASVFTLGQLFGILACSDFATAIFAPGRIEHLLALPVRRAEVLVGVYLGVLGIAVLGALYAGVVLTLVLGLKSGVWSLAIFAGGATACVGFAATYGLMLASTTLVRSSALAAAVGCGLFFAGAVLPRPELAALFDAGVGRDVFSACVSVLPRYYLLGRLSGVAIGHGELTTDMLRAAAGALVFAAACVTFAIWQFERKDH